MCLLHICQLPSDSKAVSQVIYVKFEFPSFVFSTAVMGRFVGGEFAMVEEKVWLKSPFREICQMENLLIELN